METECILCGGCVDICPVDCIEVRSVQSLVFSEKSLQFIATIPPVDVPPESRMVLIKNNETCIRCSLCVKQCPVGVFIMDENEQAEFILNSQNE